MLYGIAAAALAGVSAAIGAIVCRLNTRTSEGDREPSSYANFTISLLPSELGELLPYEFGEIEQPTAAAELVIMLLPDVRH